MEILIFRCQLYLTHGFGDCGYSYSKVPWKRIENIKFSQKNRKTVEWRHNGCFCCFQVRHSHVFIFRWIFIQLTHSYLQLIALYGVANKHTQFVSSIQYGRLKKRKTVKHKTRENRKQKVDFCWFGMVDDEYERI